MIYSKVRTDPDILFTTLMLSPQYEKCVFLLHSFFVFLLLGCWANNCGDSDGLLILSAWSCSSNWWVGVFFGWLVDLVWVFWPDAFSGSRHVCYGSCCSVAGCLLAVGGRVSPLGSIWAVEWQYHQLGWKLGSVFKINLAHGISRPPSQLIFRALPVTPLCLIVAPRRLVPVLEVVTWGECQHHSLLFHLLRR